MSEEWTSVKRLILHSSEAALGTLEDEGPFVSGAGYAVEEDENIKVALLLSDLSRHTRNIVKRPRVSLLVVESKADTPIHEKQRATLLGEAKRIEDQKKFDRLKQSYLKRFPKSEIFFSLPDFRFYEVQPEEIHWIGGFGKAKTFVFKEGAWR